MPLQTITIGTGTYLETQRATYLSDTVVHGGPRSQVKISAGIRSAKAKPPITSAGVSYLDEQDITHADGSITRERGIVNVTWQLTDHYPVANIDAMLVDISTFLTEGMLNRVTSGAS